MSMDTPTIQAEPEARPVIVSTPFRSLCYVLILIGLLSRVAPLFDQGGRLLKQFPTEDGYLMLTIARNIALGHGMSTANGEMPTNGTQPLTTFLWAACFKLAGNEKALGVAYVHGLQIVIGLVSVVLLYRLGRRLLAGLPLGREVALLATAVWYVNPLSAKHTQNCLETGFYTLIVLGVMLLYLRWRFLIATKWSAPHLLGFGALLGLAFWARNDAAFLILAICLVHSASGFFVNGPGLVRRLAESVVMGVMSIVVASPWLIYNHTQFGSIMPISGQAESSQTPFGENLTRVPTALMEYILALPIPNRFEQTEPMVALGMICIALVLLLVGYIWRCADRPMRTFLATALIYGVGLSIFYGFWFGAGYFVRRYTFPISPLLALLWATTAMVLWQLVKEKPWSAVVPIGLVLAMAAFNARLYRSGDKHQHWEVVEWVEQNVPDDVWVGAVQTGTLGFFHDYTINLDGKVNPEALEARLEGGIPEYVISKGIRYLVDWSIGEWMKLPTIREHFDMVVENEERTLTVLQRKHAQSQPATSSAAE